MVILKNKNFDLGEKGDTNIRDVFIANMQSEDIQKELFKETVELEKALTIATKLEMGTLYQLKMNASKSELNSTVIKYNGCALQMLLPTQT